MPCCGCIRSSLTCRCSRWQCHRFHFCTTTPTIRFNATRHSCSTATKNLATVDKPRDACISNFRLRYVTVKCFSVEKHFKNLVSHTSLRIFYAGMCNVFWSTCRLFYETSGSEVFKQLSDLRGHSRWLKIRYSAFSINHIQFLIIFHCDYVNCAHIVPSTTYANKTLRWGWLVSGTASQHMWSQQFQ